MTTNRYINYREQQNLRNVLTVIGVIVGGIITALVLFFIITHLPPPVRDGTVIEKRDVPAHNETYLQPIPHQSCRYIPGSGKNSTGTTTCDTTYTYIPMSRYVPEEWSLHLEKCADNSEGKNECHQGWVYISESVYNNYKTGEYYGTAK